MQRTFSCPDQRTDSLKMKKNSRTQSIDRSNVRSCALSEFAKLFFSAHLRPERFYEQKTSTTTVHTDGRADDENIGERRRERASDRCEKSSGRSVRSCGALRDAPFDRSPLVRSTSGSFTDSRRCATRTADVVGARRAFKRKTAAQRTVRRFARDSVARSVRRRTATAGGRGARPPKIL